MAGEMQLIDGGTYVLRGYYDEEGSFLIAEQVAKNSPRYAELTARPDLVQDKQWDWASRSPVAQAVQAQIATQAIPPDEIYLHPNLTDGPAVHVDPGTPTPMLTALPGVVYQPIDPGMSGGAGETPAAAPSWFKPALVIGGIVLLAKWLL